MKPISGTFLDEITWDIPSQNWGEAEWRKEFDTFRQAGIDTVIIIRSGLRDLSVYPSKVLGTEDMPDLGKLFLDEAHRTGIQLFFGSYDPGNLGWDWLKWKDSRDIMDKMMVEIQQRYGDHPAFYGWYVAPETCVGTDEAVELFQWTSNRMKELSPERPVLISPYYPSFCYKLDSEEDRHNKFLEDWERIFTHVSSIDICAFQDGSCTFDIEEPVIFELERYVKEVHQLCTSHKITQWNNVESFGRTFPIKFPPIDWRLLKRKMEIAEPYSEKHITFEFSHFMSPNSMYPAARNLYRRYRENILGENA
jgi:hypothetical protein